MDSTQYRMVLYRSDNELLHKYDTNYVTFPVAAHIAQCLVGVTGGDGGHVGSRIVVKFGKCYLSEVSIPQLC